MKLSSMSTVAAVLVIGAGGFLAGRISTSSSGGGETATGHDQKNRVTRVPAGSVSGGQEGKSAKSARNERSHKSSPADAGKDKFARLEAIVRSGNSLDRTKALLDWIEQLEPGEFESAVGLFRSLGMTQDRFGEYGILLSAWAKVDPMAALDYAKANTRNPFATKTILATWASTDPDAAIQWAKSNHDGNGANPYMADIIGTIVATDPKRASQLLVEMPRSVERGEALDAMMPYLLKQGPDAAKQWVSALSDESLRSGAMDRMARSLSETDPAGAAAWLLTDTVDARKRVMDHVYSAWAGKDKQAAVASLATLPSGEDRSNALRGTVRNLAINSPDEAVALLNRYPGDVDDKTVQNFVWHAMDQNPATAISQIGRLSDEHDREQMYFRTLSAWMEKDAAAANAYLQSHAVPPAVLQRLQGEKR